MKVKLRSFNTVIYTEEHIQEVKYFYSIDNSLGLLELDLTIPADAEIEEQFIIHLKDLYKGFKEYIVYHNKWRYRLDIDKSNYSDEWYLSKIKMY